MACEFFLTPSLLMGFVCEYWTGLLGCEWFSVVTSQPGDQLQQIQTLQTTMQPANQKCVKNLTTPKKIIVFCNAIKLYESP